jgi:hypothetical protein
MDLAVLGPGDLAGGRVHPNGVQSHKLQAAPGLQPCMCWQHVLPSN